MHSILAQFQAAVEESNDYERAMYSLAACTPAPYNEIVPAFKRFCARSVHDWRQCYRDVCTMSARGDYSWLRSA